MTVLSVSVALTRIGLLSLPIIAAQFTTGSEVDVDQLISDGGDVADAFAVSICWLPFLFCGFGGDIITHEFGLEAAMYFLALVVLKTTPFINIEWNSVYWWGPVVLLYVFYFLIVHTRYRIYYEDAGFTREEQLTVQGNARMQNASDSERKDLEAGEFQHVSIRNLVLLIGVVLGFNAGRTILFWWHSQSTLDIVFNDQDTLLLYSMAAETVLATWIMIRIRSMYSRFNRDYWRGAGGVLMLYLYFQVATIWILSTWEEIVLTFAMMVGVLVVAVVIERQVTQSHIDREEFVGLVIVQWISELINVVLSSQVGMVSYIVLTGLLAYLSQSVWYETRVIFPPLVQTIACPLQDIIDGPLQTLFQLVLGAKYRKLFALVRIPLGKITTTVAGAIFASYPYLQDGCEGADVQFKPLSTYWVVPFFVLPLLVSCFLVLYVFVEGRRVINTPGFWGFAFTVTTISTVITQLTGDVHVTLWYLLLKETDMNREYTWEGMIGSLVQILQMVVCISMYRNKKIEKEVRVQLRREAGTTNSSTGALFGGVGSASRSIVADVESAADSVARPRYLLMGVSILLFIVSVMEESPVEDISVMYGANYGAPDWLAELESQPAQIFEEDYNFVLIIEEQLLHALAAKQMFDYVVDNVDWCFGFEGFEICPFDYVSGVLDDLVDALKDASVYVAGVVVEGIKDVVDDDTVQEVIDVLLKVPSILKYPGYTFFEIPSIDVPSLRVPDWLIYSGGTIASLFLLASIAVLALQSRKALQNEIHAIKMFFMGLLISGVTSVVMYTLVLYLYLKGIGFVLTITWTSGVWRYAAAFVLFILSFFFEIGEDLEGQTERAELAESAREMNAAVGAGTLTMIPPTRVEEDWGGDEEQETESLRRPVRSRGQRLVAW